ncbi:MAG: hypothetical protein KIS67_23355 [Verrucomicrobiae bacterium]|nr:hypothetical protein [Verrucomicrobiae bacterium]
MQLPETQPGNDHAEHIETAAIEQTSRIKTVAVQRKQWGNELLQARGHVFLITFETTHALLLPGGRFLRPRSRRVESAK